VTVGAGGGPVTAGQTPLGDSRPDSARWILPVVLLVGLVAGLGLLQASGLAFWEGQVVILGVFVILVVSLNLASGFTGVFSLGHIGFMALGAYISAILTLPITQKAAYLPDLPDWLASVHFDQVIAGVPIGWFAATVLAGLVVAVVALGVGAVVLRLSGNFVAVATLGFLVIVRVILFNADAYTRGSRTFSNVTPYTDLWWAWGWAVVVVYVVWRIKRSSYGRSMFAQRRDRWAAQAVGISILRPRLLAFVISAFFCGVAGSLYAHFLTSFSPTVFYFDLTFRVITMLVVGGLGSVSGSVLGAAVILALGEGLRRVEDVTLLYGISGILLAVFFLLVIIFRPEGIMGQSEISLGGITRRFRRDPGGT
jgi:branched-chain amino acid transport system permease protein